jgi:hypothetical protein
MTIDNLKFPAGIVFLAAIAVPTIEHAVTGGFSAITYVVEAICGIAVLGFVIVAAVNSATKK